MKQLNLKALSSETLEQLRAQAINLRKKAYTGEQIAQTLNISQRTIYRWLALYRAGGSRALKTKKRGRPVGDGRSLSPEQEKQIKRLLIDKDPRQYKLDFALWTRRAVKELVNQEFSIEMPIRTVGLYLQRWGFTPQKPLRRAYEQNPKAVGKWLKEDYPAIRRQAKEQGADIHWADETGLRSDCQHGRSYAPRGRTPAIALNGRRHAVNLISSITNQGKVRFMFYEENFNSAVFIKFLTRLIEDADRPIFMIVDNLRVHHSRQVEEWLQDKQERLRLFWLPSYSPELNPDEYLNCDLKAGVHSKPPARSQDELKKKCPLTPENAPEEAAQSEEIF